MGRLAAGLLAFGGAFAGAADDVAAQPVAGGPWAPTRHPQDDWLDALPGQHRLFFDANSPAGVGDAITYASNFYVASKSGYALADAENTVIIGLRHHATAFAFGDAIWAKYGAPLAERIRFSDPRNSAPPVINVYQTTGYGTLLTNREVTLAAMIGRGTHFAVCDMATRAFAGVVAGKLSLKSAEVYEEMRATALPNSHFVPAGIVAVNRAQERGYAIQHIG